MFHVKENIVLTLSVAIAQVFHQRPMVKNGKSRIVCIKKTVNFISDITYVQFFQKKPQK